MSHETNHRWTFVPRFRKGAFGWRSQPAILRIREAYDRTMRAAEIIGCRESVLSRIRKLAEKNSDGGRILAAILRQDPGGMR